MTMQDPISDMLTRIRNGQMARHRQVTMPQSKVKAAIAQVLVDEGYIEGFALGEGIKAQMTVDLKYYRGAPVIEELQRVSRPGLRRYRHSGGIPKVRGGLGVAVVSTSRGVMSDRAARAQGIGGEVLCTVY